MSSADITQFAPIAHAVDYLLAARAGAAAVPALRSPLHSEAEAYAVQDAVRQRLGRGISGWKVSMPSAIEGKSAPVLDGDLYEDHVQLPLAPAARVGIEPEIAFRLRQGLAPRSRPYRDSEVLEAVQSAHAAIEIVVSRFVTHEGAPALDQLADNISNGGLVIGPAREDWRALALQRLPLTLTLAEGGQPAMARLILGGHPLGDPLLPLVWLANHLSERGFGLLPGTVVTTGSCAGLSYISAGGFAEARFEGLGSVRVQR